MPSQPKMTDEVPHEAQQQFCQKKNHQSKSRDTRSYAFRVDLLWSKSKKTLNFKQLFAPSLSLAGAPRAAYNWQGVTSQSVPRPHICPLPIVSTQSFPDSRRVRLGKVSAKQVQGTPGSRIRVQHSLCCIGEGDQLTKEQVYPCCRTISSNPVTIHRVIRGRLGSPRQNVEQKKAGGGHLGATMKGGSSRKAPPHDPLPSTRRLSQTSLQQVFTSSNTSRHLCQKLMYKQWSHFFRIQTILSMII